ncbi:hypothetical protein BDZ90DRAFT_233713 [Jaminaea rosea]|uniref:Queuosine salvage protein n=1 Tax=Jaminaea rosea TaxID=1569628 RepID=A0A316UK74_9BASI|nr:hypothetical protein BDZ90DRAFT_233713 [Jaminaea rosea]PWN25702.1 hypothetical protein BDZ90DRAFT_233713 [Jaminaea rosea]
MPSISAEPPLLPSASTLLREVRSSCTQCSLALDEAAIDALLQSIASSSYSRQPPSLRDYSLSLPLRWDSLGAELNFISLIALLSILSPLQKHIDALPSDTPGSPPPSPAMLTRQLLLGLYLSAPPSNHLSAPSPLSAGHLAGIQENEVAEVLNLKIHVERKVEHIPVATLAERGGPGSEVVKRLTECLNRVGKRLVESRYVDLGAFVAETLRQCKGMGSEEEAMGTFVRRLASFLPLDFGADSYTVSHPQRGGEDVPLHLYKNAWYLLCALVLRFSGADEEERSKLPWLPTTSSLDEDLPLLADGFVVESLVARGVLRLDEEEGSASSPGLAKLRNVLSSKGQASEHAQRVVLTADEYNVLRASVVSLGEALRKRRGEIKEQGVAVTPARLDAWLRRSGTPEAHRKVRLIIKDEGQISAAGMW